MITTFDAQSYARGLVAYELEDYSGFTVSVEDGAEHTEDGVYVQIRVQMPDNKVSILYFKVYAENPPDISKLLWFTDANVSVLLHPDSETYETVDVCSWQVKHMYIALYEGVL